MKWTHRLCILMAIFCAGIPSARARADQAGTMEFSLDYNKSWTDWGTSGETLGGGVGAGIGYWRAVSPDLSWGLEASYDNLGKLEYANMDPSASGTVRFDSKVLRFNPAFRANFGPPGEKNFLAQFGAGLYNVTWKYHYEDVFIYDVKDSETKFGFNLGAGGGFPLGGAKRMNVMALYHFIAGEEAFAGDFNYLQVRASLGISL